MRLIAEQVPFAEQEWELELALELETWSRLKRLSDYKIPLAWVTEFRWKKNEIG